MPRWARPHRPACLHHLIGRFVNREFRLRGAVERGEYLARLAAALAKSDWTLLGFALMSSHVHLCAISGQEPSAPLMRSVHGGFAGWLNRRQGRLGPVFADRYRSVVCPAERAQDLLAYIHNNPVRAGVVRDAADSTWTSHAFYLERPAPAWLQVERGLLLCGRDTSRAGRQAFAQEVAVRAGGPRDPVLSGGDLPGLWAQVRREAGGPVELSAAELQPDGTPEHQVWARPGASLRPRWPGAPEEVLAHVAARTGVSVARMRSTDRTREVVRARRLAVWVYSRELARPQVEMAQVLGLSAASANNLLRRLPRVGLGAGWPAEVLGVAQVCRERPGGGGAES